MDIPQIHVSVFLVSLIGGVIVGIHLTMESTMHLDGASLIRSLQYGRKSLYQHSIMPTEISRIVISSMDVDHRRIAISLPIVPTMRNASTVGSYSSLRIFWMQTTSLNVRIVRTHSISGNATIFTLDGIFPSVVMRGMYFRVLAVKISSDACD